MVSHPLNEQIAKLLIDILKLERDRDKHQDALENPTSTQLADELIETRGHKAAVESLTREIDLRRQELISLELLMLDNSIKDLKSTTGQVDNSIKSLQSTMGQVDCSVKALQTTAEQTLRSSKKLERLTNILIFVTILLAIIGIYNISIVLFPTNPLVGWTGTLGSGVLAIYALWKMVPALRKKA
jgi:nitrate/nitrite-specific signal transduction histidine kinase